jgi:hypothetical protein
MRAEEGLGEQEEEIRKIAATNPVFWRILTR